MRRREWFCAALLLAALAVAVLHVAAPHLAAKLHCATCAALTSPAEAHHQAVPARPAALTARLAADHGHPPIAARARLLRPLRAPPAPAAI